MATLGTYDEANLSAEDKKKIQAYKVAWADSKLKNDKKGMESANAAAEAIRANYGYAGGKDGNGYSVVAKPVAQAPTVQAPTVQVPTVQVPDNSAQIQSIYSNLNAANSASITAARDQANSDYQSQIEAAPAQFQPLRDQADLGAVRNIQRANEVAAAKGTTFSGGVQSDAGGIVASAEGQKTALNQQEANVVTSLKKAIADNNRASSLKEIEMTAQNNAQMQNALMANNDKMFDRTYQMGRDQVTDSYNMAGLTGYFNGNRTLQGQQMDTSNKQWDEQMTFNKEQFKSGLDQWQKQFDYQKGRDKVLDSQWEKSFISNESNAAAGRAVQWAGLNLDRQKFEESKKAMVEGATGLSEHAKEIYKNALDKINSTTKVSDQYGNVIDKPVDPATIFQFIDDSSLSEEEKLMIIERIPGL